MSCGGKPDGDLGQFLFFCNDDADEDDDVSCSLGITDEAMFAYQCVTGPLRVSQTTLSRIEAGCQDHTFPTSR